MPRSLTRIASLLSVGYLPMRRVKLGSSHAAELYRSKPLVPQSILSDRLPNSVYQIFCAGVAPAIYATSLGRKASSIVLCGQALFHVYTLRVT
jgi:hypothetical protein